MDCAACLGRWHGRCAPQASAAPVELAAGIGTSHQSVTLPLLARMPSP